MSRLVPEDLKNNPRFQLLEVLDHRQVKSFVYEQIGNSSKWLQVYGIYQVAMLLLFLVLLGYTVSLAFQGEPLPLYAVLGAMVFSVTLLVVLHESIHALAYRAVGARHLKSGVIWRKFVFYVAAHRQVLDYPAFRLVALAPLVVVKLLCLLGFALLGFSPAGYFMLSVLFLHSLFCGGDVAMLAFYEKHADKTIYTYDDLEQEKTFFYFVRGIDE